MELTAPLSGGALLRLSHLEAAAAARRMRSRWVVGGFGGAGKGKGWWVEAAANSEGEGVEEAAAMVEVELGSRRRGFRRDRRLQGRKMDEAVTVTTRTYIQYSRPLCIEVAKNCEINSRH